MRQRGSVVINAALALSVIVIALIGTELGYLFYQKRSLQRAADLAALAAARRLPPDFEVCTNARTAAEANALQNLVSFSGEPPTITTACGHWTAPPPEASENVDGFTEATDGAGTELTAVRVAISATPGLLLPNIPGNAPRTISVSAVARLDQPLASFSVGSTLIGVGDSLLGNLLKGIGLDLTGTTLAGYDGLAQVTITPGGLLAALDIPVAADISVGDLNALLAAQSVSLGELLDAIVTVAGQNALVDTNLALLSAIRAKLGVDALNLQLGSLADPPSGLFAQIIAPDSSAKSALNIGLGALDMVYAAIGVATANHAVETGLNLDLLSLAKVTTKVAVIEPPSIAIGGIGAKAYTAQVRTFVHIKTDSGLLGTLLSPLIKLDLPIALDLVTGTGELTAMCRPELRLDEDDADRALIDVSSSILKLCVGHIPASDLFSVRDACGTSLSSMELVNVLGLLRVNDKLNVNGLPGTSQQVALKPGETVTTEVNPLPLGTLVADLVSQLSSLLFGGTPSSGNPTGPQLDNLTDKLWSDTAAICTQNTSYCRGQRYSSAITTIRDNAQQSGLLTGLLNGVVDLLSGILNSCTGLLGIGGNADGCKSMIKDALSSSSNSGSGAVSNALSVLVGLLQPVLDALGSAILTPLLQNVLGINIGEIDVHLRSLDCHTEPVLVY